MRVDLYNSTAATEATNHVDKINTDRSLAAKKQASGQKVETEDTTSLTSSSDSVQALTSTALQTIPSRAVKVESLKRAVNNAQYQLDAAKIADAISNSDL